MPTSPSRRKKAAARSVDVWLLSGQDIWRLSAKWIRMLAQRYQRASRMAGVLPLGQMSADGPDLAAIFWSLPTAALEDRHKQDITAWKAEVAPLWPEIAPFLHKVRAPEDLTPARYRNGTLRRPFAGLPVRIGDAAHRASPQLGQGANMALLDALAVEHAVSETLGHR